MSTLGNTLLLLSRFSHVQLCATPQTAAHQALPSLGFSRQEYSSGVPLPSPMHACMLSRFSRAWLCVTPWTAAHQAPLSTELSRQEYWNGLPFPSPIYALPWVKQLVRSCYITQEPSLVLCDDLEEWERGGEKSSRGRGYSIIMAELNCYTAESNTTLESNFPTS